MDKASATETVNSGSIPGLLKPKTRKIGICSVFARLSAIKRESVKPLLCVVNR